MPPPAARCPALPCQFQKTQCGQENGRCERQALPVDLTPGLGGHRAQVVVNPQQSLSRGTHFTGLQCQGDGRQCGQPQLGAIQAQELPLGLAHLAGRFFGETRHQAGGWLAFPGKSGGCHHLAIGAQERRVRDHRVQPQM